MLVSGQLFQERCKWNMDNRYPIRMWILKILVRRGDTVFMKVSDIPLFVSSFAQHLPVKITAVVHNSDESFTDDHYKLLQPYVDRVFAVNNVSPFAMSIPLGFRDHQYISHHVLKKIANEPEIPRTIKCLVNFLISTNPTERGLAYEKFKDKSFCTVQDYINYDFSKSLAHSLPETMEKRAAFYNTLRSSKFAICPQGTGIDTHRVYECILFGVIPIVTSSPLDRIYNSLPVWIVSSWDDVTEDALDACPIVPNRSAVINFRIPWE